MHVYICTLYPLGGDTKCTWKPDTLEDQLEYKFRVRVQTTDGVGSWSEPVSCQRQPPCMPTLYSLNIFTLCAYAQQGQVFGSVHIFTLCAYAQQGQAFGSVHMYIYMYIYVYM